MDKTPNKTIKIIDKEELENWRLAGKITGQVREYSRTVVKPGVKLIDAAELIENKIFELGAKPAFPVNLSLNDCAAHYTPITDDSLIFEDQLVKVDVGAHVNGAIGDTALTIDLSGKYSDLVLASKEALNAAIESVKQGASIGNIGNAVQEKISSYGFSPITNLSGHGLSKFNVHDSPSIPNYNTHDPKKIIPGSVIAIEPFATLGRGQIYESGNALIYSVVQKKGIRNVITKKVFNEIEKYQSLPFATRWLAKKFPLAQVNYAMKDLMQLGVLNDYPPLVDINHGLVSQTEHTLYIDENGKVEILTKWDE